MKKKFSKKEKITLGVLVGLMVAVIAFGAFVIVGNVNKANEETKKITPTSSSSSEGETEAVSTKAAKKDKETSSKSSKGSKTSSKTSSKTDSKASSSASQSSKASTSTSTSTSSKATSSKSTSSKAKDKGDKVTKVVPEPVSDHKSESVLTVNGKKCYVGDTITVVFNIKSNKKVVNYQGYSTFDTSYLKLKEVMPNSFGLAQDSDNQIIYNASTPSGMDFSETGTVYSATFEVLKSGSTSVKNTLEIISELDSSNYPVQLADGDYKTKIEIYD